MPLAVFIDGDENLTGVYENLKLAREHCGVKFKTARFKTVPDELAANDFILESAVEAVRALPIPSSPIPKTQPVCMFKTPEVFSAVVKAIVCDDVSALDALVQENPLHLVTTNDTPSIIQMGIRVNAMHVAAAKGSIRRARYIIDQLSSGALYQRLYPEEDPAARSRHTLDSMLNTPDKLRWLTPLHKAASAGHIELIKLLVSQPMIQLRPLDKSGHFPTAPGGHEFEKEITMMLDGLQYVYISRPDPEDPLVSPPGPVQRDLESNATRIGPMSPVQAQEVHKELVSPGYRRRKANLMFDERLNDTMHGLERVAKDISLKLAIPCVEYFDFLKVAIDLQTDEGLDLLNEYFRQQHCEDCSCEVAFSNASDADVTWETPPPTQTTAPIASPRHVTPPRSPQPTNYSSPVFANTISWFSIVFASSPLAQWLSPTLKSNVVEDVESSEDEEIFYDVVSETFIERFEKLTINYSSPEKSGSRADDFTTTIVGTVNEDFASCKIFIDGTDNRCGKTDSYVYRLVCSCNIGDRVYLSFWVNEMSKLLKS